MVIDYLERPALTAETCLKTGEQKRVLEGRRAIVTGGNQDFDVEVMQPLDPRVRVVASSCDHTVLDVTDCAQDYPVGATVRLECGYHAILRAFTSSYVEKVYL